MRTPLVAGNWKLHKTSTEAYKLVAEMLPVLRTIREVEVLVCPPFTSLMAVSRLIKDTNLRLGAQNMYWEEKGAFTGEVSPSMVAEFCQYVILGHSERRALFGETDNAVSRKVKAALSAGLRPIVCVGETLEENEAGRTSGVLARQVRDALLGVDLLDIQKLVIAYEPVWAIGTGKAATADGVNALIADTIRGTLRSMFGEEAAGSIRVLYGGSVKPENAIGFFRQPEIDGALVGGASLDAKSFVALVEAART